MLNYDARFIINTGPRGLHLNQGVPDLLLTENSIFDEESFVKLCKDEIKLDTEQVNIIKSNNVKVHHIGNPQTLQTNTNKPQPLLIIFTNEKYKTIV